MYNGENREINYRDLIIDELEMQGIDIGNLLVMGLVKWLSEDDAKRFCQIYEIQV